MVARLNRRAGLPQLVPQRVDSPVIQRAVDAIAQTLIGVVEFLQPIAQREKWQLLTPFFSGDWTNSAFTDRAEFRKDPFGNVEVRLWAASALGTTNTIAVLPEGYRPAHRESFSLSRFTGGAYSLAIVAVDTDGRILIASPAMPAAAIELSLSGIRFSTEAQ